MTTSAWAGETPRVTPSALAVGTHSSAPSAPTVTPLSTGNGFMALLQQGQLWCQQQLNQSLQTAATSTSCGVAYIRPSFPPGANQTFNAYRNFQTSQGKTLLQ